MVLGKLPMPGRPTILITVGQRPIALAVGAGWFGHFYSHLSFLLFLPPLWETARYRLKYCLKGPLSPKQPTTVGQGPIALAIGAGGGGLDIFTLIYPFSSFFLSLRDGPI